jgi:DNA modification methylase
VNYRTHTLATDGTLYQGHVLDVLPQLAAESVHCVVTSPPYWGLRKYDIPDVDFPAGEFIPMAGLPPVAFAAWSGQLGLEPDPLMYTGHLVQVFREIRRVLRQDGTAWVNLGDTYCTRGGPRVDYLEKSGLPGGKATLAVAAAQARASGGNGLKPKDLIGLPWRVALALQADGWWLRSEVIWHKPNPMPSSVKDRPTPAHEQLFLLSRCARYFYDGTAIQEPAAACTTHDATGPGYAAPGQAPHTGSRPKRQHPTALSFGRPVAEPERPGQDYPQHRPERKQKVPGGWDTGTGAHGAFHREGRGEPEYRAVKQRTVRPCDDRGGGQGSGAMEYPLYTRNKRSVWTIPTHPFPEAHFATFPPALVTPCIKAGTSERGVCAACGAPWERVSEVAKDFASGSGRSGNTIAGKNGEKCQGGGDTGDIRKGPVTTTTTTGFRPSCACAAGVATAVVLDPFGGSGTVAAVARELGRRWISVELGAGYCEMHKDRLPKQVQARLEAGA